MAEAEINHVVRYQAECPATVTGRLAEQQFFAARDATHEKRLRQAGYLINGNLDPKRCRIERDRLVLAGELHLTHTEVSTAASTVLCIVTWTLATLYHSRDVTDQSTPPGLVLRIAFPPGCPQHPNTAPPPGTRCAWGDTCQNAGLSIPPGEAQP